MLEIKLDFVKLASEKAQKMAAENVFTLRCWSQFQLNAVALVD